MDFGLGTYGSRSLAVGGSALVMAADKIIEKGKKIAAHMMKASIDQVEFNEGNFTLTDSNQSGGRIRILCTCGLSRGSGTRVERKGVL